MTEFGLLRRPAPSPSPTAAHDRNALVMRRALTYARDFGAVIAHETEDHDLAAGGVMNEGSTPAGSACRASRARRS
jgi:dihydroorotase